MKKLLLVCMFVLLAATPVMALDFDFSGNMPYHNSVLQFSFVSGGAGTVTLFSSSWLDGDHGFDPMLGLWNSAGNLVHFQDDGGIVGSTMSNGVSYNHGVWDSYYSAAISAGTYYVTLTTYANFNKGNHLSDGFSYDGETPIPIPLWNEPANGYQTSDYEFHILNVTSAVGPAVPEPSTFLLVGLGIAGVGILARRRSRS